jgi:hypothetical protein
VYTQEGVRNAVESVIGDSKWSFVPLVVLIGLGMGLIRVGWRGWHG